MSKIKCVVQRCNQAKLLVDNKDEWIDSNFGVIVYVCFQKECTNEEVIKMAKTIFSLKLFKAKNDPIDSNTTRAISQLEEDDEFDLLIVPQASLGGRAKGNSVQYHANVSRDNGKLLYDSFIDECKKLAQTTKSKRVAVLHGTYGNRQALKFESDGPFSHLIEI